ncbi:PIG-L family deacetylase [Halobacillus locisalis]|uniref:PIG-L family deacetylase n=1 Tax=Halobacillus locisalis TaxID=220753 RepID=A0A838CTY4_9BACI|nr:PIG-L deacetylase family protein [Halobacillus locisalis]MBA2175358.1 PIG-L family deacetylase [Halobacillus locisalis]
MKVLVFAPHNDDEVLGVGGTIAKYSELGYEIYVCEVTSGDNPERVKQIQEEALKAHKILGVKETIFLGLPVVKLRHTPTVDINSKTLEVVEKIKPNLVFVPHKGDMHQDHAEVTTSAMVALRPFNNPQLKAIYAYETLSETEWNTPTIDNAFIPSVWSDITDTIDLKLQAMDCFITQVKEFPHPRSLEAIEALSKLRGSTVCVKNAESFMLMRSNI